MDAQDFRRLQEAYLGVYQELDEASPSNPKLYTGRHGQTPQKYQDDRSDTGKRFSGDSKSGPIYYTLGRARGAKPDAPTEPGARPVGTPKLASWEKDYIKYRQANLNAGKVHKVGGPKGLPEETDLFDYLLEYLVAEGYADTNDAAIAIMANMSEEWRDGILQQLDELSDWTVRAARNRLKRNTQRAPGPDRQQHANREFRFNQRIQSRNQRTGSNVSPTDVEFRNR